MAKYIEAEKTIKILRNALSHEEDANDAEIIIRNMPAADVEEVRHGRWYKGRVSSTGGGSYGVYQCSICEAMFPDVGYGYNYCPNCGSRMDL